MPTIVDDLLEIIAWARMLFGKAEDAVTGSITQSVNAILDIKELDCGGNWVLYVKTASIGLGHALYLLLTPSGEEILENYLEPKPGRRYGRRGRRKGRERRPVFPVGTRLFFTPPIPDIDEQIAARIPGSGFFKGRKIGASEFIFWTSINVADAVLWHWLLIEASRTFAAEWQSALMESGECIKEGEGHAIAQTIDLPAKNAFPIWAGLNELTVNNAKTFVIGNNGGISLDQASLRAEGFLLIDLTFTGTNENGTETSQYQVGFGASLTPGQPHDPDFVERGLTLNIPKDGAATITVGLQMAINALNTIQVHVKLVGLGTSGSNTIRYNANIAIHAGSVFSV